MGVPLAALAVQPPPSPLEQASKLVGLQSGLQEQQLRAQQLKQAQYQFGATQAMNEAYKGAVTVDENGQPKFDTDALTKSLAANGYGSQVPEVLKHITDFQQSQANLKKTMQETAESQQKMQVQQTDMMGSVGAAIKAANYDPGLADTFLQHFEINNPQSKAQVDQMRQQMQQNPGMVRQIADNLIAASPKQQELETARQTAQARQTAAQTGLAHLQAELPGGPLNRVAQETAIATNPQIQQGKINVAAAEGQARANVEAQMARGSSAALANVPPHLIAPASAAATKAGEDYAQAQSVTQRLNAMMAAAKSGNVVSYQLLPQEGALQLTTSQGVHRINMAEIQNYGGGSLWQRMEGHIGKQLTGKSIPESVLNDMADMQKIQAEGAEAKYNNSLKTINQTYGSNFQPVQMELMKTAPEAQPAKANLQIGQTVSIKGKPMKITKVYPNGTFDAQ
jgi:hypothetical protein